jgi:hypothetical protein
MTTIKLKNGSGAPTAGDLAQGEPALDLTNKRLYTEDSGGTVIEVGTNPSTINIDAGTIDGAVIGGSSAAAITGTTITGTSFVSSGNMTFGDNDKAIFGAGSDLQIYHDGSNSYIAEGGTGELLITSNGTGIRLQKNNGENMIKALTDGAVQLYYDNQDKLATTSTGIDVTGTVTADGLTVDGAASVVGNITQGNGDLLYSGGGNWDIAHTIASQNIIFKTTPSGGSETQRIRVSHNGDISFYEDTGTTAKLFWDASAESLGIGTSSPSATLHLYHASVNEVLLLESGDANVNIEFQDTIATVNPRIGANGNDFRVITNNAEAMRQE